ncbi:hypothetical protein [Celeribacter marinus]|uniref:hypothetical protein n=1 Tax=Celeribacter marinus TaxID=1397108 RepID=UPI00317A1FC0
MPSILSVLLVGTLAAMPSVAAAKCVSLTVHNTTLEDLTAVGVADYDNTNNAVGLTEWLGDGNWEAYDFCLDATRFIVVGVGGGKTFISDIYALDDGTIHLDISDRKNF